MDVPILAYHKVSNKLEWGINSVPIKSFQNQIEYLYYNNYFSISLLDFINNTHKFFNNRKPVIITFDDADGSVYENAFPILKKYGFTASLFIISNYVGKKNTWDVNLGGMYSQHLGWDQILHLSNEGWEVGSHTANHPDLLKLSSCEVLSELQLSREKISIKIDQPVNFISYPFNRFDKRIVSLVKQSGYLGGCALFVNRKRTGFSEKFKMKRYGVYSIDGINSIKQKLKDSPYEHLKQGVISFCSRGTIWYNRLRN